MNLLNKYTQLTLLRFQPIKVLPKFYGENNSAIVLEYFDLSSLSWDCAQILGYKLADLHDFNRKTIKHEEKTLSWVGKIVPSEKGLLQDEEDTSLKDEEQTLSKHNFSKNSGLVKERQNFRQQVNDDSEILIEKFILNPDLKPIREFGFHVQTSCGLLPQINEWTDDWVSFFARYRLDHPIRLVINTYSDRELNEQWSHLQLKLSKFFGDYTGKEKIVPSLLHGDLWSGNVGQIDASTPVIYDPSSFYGHHEYEFGVARMFGDIPKSFETSYFKVIPRKNNFELRNKLYQLYHHLNHWNHFGSSYRSSSLSLIKSLNASV